jgi:1-acyl-sn-glycerol-3-phosphate acyltransferase
MQFFKFIFLARSWASDRKQLAVSLASLGREAESENTPLCFIVYPEGTLVSKDTRPKSKKFADKMGIVSLEPFQLRTILTALIKKARYAESAPSKIYRAALQPTFSCS